MRGSSHCVVRFLWLTKYTRLFWSILFSEIANDTRSSAKRQQIAIQSARRHSAAESVVHTENIAGWRRLTPAFRQRAVWVVTRNGLCWVEWATSDVIDGAVLAHLLELLNIVHHVDVRPLPRRRPCVVIDVIRPSSRVRATFPSVQRHVSIHRTLPSTHIQFKYTEVMQTTYNYKHTPNYTHTQCKWKISPCSFLTFWPNGWKFLINFYVKRSHLTGNTFQ